jgi:hypothetical protein
VESQRFTSRIVIHSSGASPFRHELPRAGCLPATRGSAYDDEPSRSRSIPSIVAGFRGHSCRLCFAATRKGAQIGITVRLSAADTAGMFTAVRRTCGGLVLALLVHGQVLKRLGY